MLIPPTMPPSARANSVIAAGSLIICVGLLAIGRAAFSLGFAIATISMAWAAAVQTRHARRDRPKGASTT